MFRRLQSVLSPMSAMRIDPISQPHLSEKLHSITEHIINSSKQFDAWMQLQNNNRLHYCLFEVYLRGCKGDVSEEELASILQFYTLLIINSKDQLLLCKIVSDDFVIQLCQLKQLPHSLAADLEAYRINLIKAYMSTITPETVKYMVLQDKFKVFYICVELYYSKIGTGTVESTTIANALLNAIKKVDAIPFLWESIWVPQGLQLLLTQCLGFIEEQLTGISSKKKIAINQNKSKLATQEKNTKQKLQQKQKQQQEVQVDSPKVVKTKQQLPQQNQNIVMRNSFHNQQLQSNEKENMTENSSKIQQPQQKFSQNKQIKQMQQVQEQEQKQNENQKQCQKIENNSKASETNQQAKTEASLIQSTHIQQQIKQQYQQKLKDKAQLKQQQQQQQKDKQWEKQAEVQIGQQLKKGNIQVLQQIVLFVIELHSSISSMEIKKQITQYCYMDLQQIMAIVNKYSQFQSKVYSFSVLFALFKTYSFEQQAIETLMELWMPSILNYVGNGNQSTYSMQEIHTNNQTMAEQICKEQKGQLSELLCRCMFILCKVVSSKYSLLSERWMDQNASIQKVKGIQRMRTQILSMLVSRLSACLDQLETSEPSLLLHFIKNILLTTFNLKIAISFSVPNTSNNEQHSNKEKEKQLQYKLDQTILQLFLAYTAQFKKLMYRNELWNSIIKWYEQAAAQVANNLLTINDTFDRIAEEKPYIIMLTYEYIKNYRYMIVESTTMDPKAIKQEKFYHTTFTSPGMAYAPGLIVTDVLNIVCPCLMHHNYQQIPVVIIEDKQCFIVGIKVSENEYKILANIKFKDIEGLVYGSTQGTEGKNNSELPKFVKINLKGMQQILLQFSNPKIVGNAFKEYLIRSRDMTRQRQLTFLNAWIKDYQTDTENSLETVKQLLNKRDYILP